MYGAQGLTFETTEFVELSFRALEGWTSFFNGAFSTNFVTAGDQLTGPALGLVAYAPGEFPKGPPHSHATDSLRLCLRGEYGIARTSYRPGDFRFQKGWVPYVDERFGVDGNWVLIMAGDRRGSRARPVDEELANSEMEMMIRQMSKSLTTSFGIEVDDWISDDPADTAGPSALVGTIGAPTASGKIDGSFADRDKWAAVGAGTRAAVTLLGAPHTGPVVVLSSTEPNERASARCAFDTEIVRMVVRGGCTIGDRSYEPGDIRIQLAGTWCDDVVAGPDGVDQLVVVGDRRHASATVDPALEGQWPAGLASTVAQLAGRLS